MSMPPIAFGQYPEPQQFYHINLSAMTWGEIWRSSGNLLLFAFITAPLVGFCKLFGIRLTFGGRFPREVSFARPDLQTYRQSYTVVASLLSETQTLGFEHFTTFSVLEMPFRNVVFAMMNANANAYAAHYYVLSPLKAQTATEFMTQFVNGSELTTTNAKEGVLLEAPSHHFRQLLMKASPPQLWEAHQERVAELAAHHGGISGPVGQEHFIECWRKSIRESADFHASRGVYVSLA
ncbi:MAG: hypothetical protein ACUVX8_11510 [Candidatus Zipacnadales bacterium]